VTAPLDRTSDDAVWQSGVALSQFSEIPELTEAERAVADALPIGADPEAAERVLRQVPLWFHTFALNAEHGLYTPGVARDHRYRVPVLPASFAGQRVLDVGTFDGFYAFLAERRGAARVVAVDSEQYVAWVKARWGVDLEGGAGFRAIAELLGSRVEYVRGDALAFADTDERFDVVLCFGILHRVENPLGLLRGLGGLLAPGGRMLVETLGVDGDSRPGERRIEVHAPSDVYQGDDFVYWGFGGGGLGALATLAGFSDTTIDATPTIDGYPRIMATLERPTSVRAAEAHRPNVDS
jgi:SAM-dependent methyltransferase